MTRLNHSFEQIRQFSTDVSHELRTPLTVVRGQLEVALFTAQTVEQYREAMADALEGVERLSNIVRALLMLSQAESGQLALQKTELDLADLVRDLVDQHQIPAEAEGVRLAATLPDNCTMQRRPHSDRAAGLESVGQCHQIHAGGRQGEGEPDSEFRSREADCGRYRSGNLAQPFAAHFRSLLSRALGGCGKGPRARSQLRGLDRQSARRNGDRGKHAAGRHALHGAAAGGPLDGDAAANDPETAAGSVPERVH